MNMNADDVAEYLKAHPEFFDRQGELLTQLSLPSPHGDAAVSLGERQRGVLRNKQRELEAKLVELIRFGEANDAIAEKVHALAVALIGAADFTAVQHALYTDLGSGFGVPQVALRLWGFGAAEVAGAAEFSPVSDRIKAIASGLSFPSCGSATNQEAAEWFGPQAGQVRSLAQIPLAGKRGCAGLLVLGSDDLERFYPDMGVLYLTRIGEMAAAALRRVLGPD
jgi:hypothetical protein